MKNSLLKTIEKNTLMKAFEIAVKYQLSHWDSLVVATTLKADCNTLYSEDKQHGRLIEGKLTIINPFLIV